MGFDRFEKQVTGTPTVIIRVLSHTTGTYNHLFVILFSIHIYVSKIFCILKKDLIVFLLYPWC